jgi:hypothetical protein
MVKPKYRGLMWRRHRRVRVRKIKNRAQTCALLSVEILRTDVGDGRRNQDGDTAMEAPFEAHDTDELAND